MRTTVGTPKAPSTSPLLRTEWGKFASQCPMPEQPSFAEMNKMLASAAENQQGLLKILDGGAPLTGPVCEEKLVPSPIKNFGDSFPDDELDDVLKVRASMLHMRHRSSSNRFQMHTQRRPARTHCSPPRAAFRTSPVLHHTP